MDPGCVDQWNLIVLTPSNLYVDYLEQLGAFNTFSSQGVDQVKEALISSKVSFQALCLGLPLDGISRLVRLEMYKCLLGIPSIKSRLIWSLMDIPDITWSQDERCLFLQGLDITIF